MHLGLGLKATAHRPQTHRIVRWRDAGGLGGFGLELAEELFDFLFVSFFHSRASELRWASQLRPERNYNGTAAPA